MDEKEQRAYRDLWMAAYPSFLPFTRIRDQLNFLESTLQKGYFRYFCLNMVYPTLLAMWIALFAGTWELREMIMSVPILFGIIQHFRWRAIPRKIEAYKSELAKGRQRLKDTDESQNTIRFLLCYVFGPAIGILFFLTLWEGK